MSRTLFCFIALVIQLYHVNTANILGLFPYPGKSHHMVFEPLLRKLAERGHNVTVGSFFPAKDPPSNYTDISFKGIAKLNVEFYDLSTLDEEPIFFKIPRLGRLGKQVLQMTPFRRLTLSICERLVNFKPLLDALKEKYDIVIVENFTSDCLLGLLHVYGIRAPIVTIVSGPPLPWSSKRIGYNNNPSYVPVVTAPFATQMSFFDRVENTLIYFLLNDWFNDMQINEKAIIEEKYGEIPSLSELGKNTSLMLVNAYHTLTGVKPLVPGYVEVGGMHLSAKYPPLPQNIEKFVNESTHGVILFSFGTHIRTKSMPRYKEQIFINVLSKLKQRVIWKYEDSDAHGTLTGNILKVNWLPQYDLLRHEKVIAFISHGGMLGMTEAMSAGKPMIVIPIFGDQPSNAAAAAESGVGVVLSYIDLTEETLHNALQNVLSTEMQLHTRRMSQIWHDRESAPLERAVFWTEHVMRWGATRLHSTARDLPLYQLALLDVAAFIVFIILAFVFIVTYISLKLIKTFKKNYKVKVQ